MVEKTYGTASKLKESQLTFAGKTGTSQINYNVEDELNYVSSFAGYFPAENPKYSCIVVIDKPDKSRQIYGRRTRVITSADVVWCHLFLCALATVSD